MSLSRLDNFLNSPRGTIFYVDANALDATDSIENRGTSQTRPFRTIQRALAEVARYSYQRGLDNDRFAKSTVLVAPGTYFIDNRPGAVLRDNNTAVLRSGAGTTINEWDLISNFDLAFDENDLYKLNSVHGGVILPRGCSLIGADYRKVKIVPLYVPNPANDNIERSAVFRVTGACFIFGFTIFDSDPNGNCYKDYTKNLFVPNFSHHKLTGFEYADGVNNVLINDDFQSVQTSRTDLDMYYAKIARVYGDNSGRPIEAALNDIEPIVDEYRIVGSRGKEIGITSIRAGDDEIPSITITVTLEESLNDLSVDSPIQISGVGAEGYDGQYVVSAILSSTEIQYKVQNIPSNPLPGVSGATLNLVVDTITSASPYIFNVALRSVYGMCGLHADGSKSEGFKSMVVAQYTGIGLQKDDNAFVIYNSSVGEYTDIGTNLHTNSRSRFKPEYENFHIKASNNAFLQLVSVFAIGYAQHFIAESGGDFSITNSNSNFGAKSLVSSGFRDEAFTKDDVGYITHIIPPQELETEETSIEFLSIDVGLTTSVASSNRLYLYNEDNINNPPTSVFDGYRIGAKRNEILRVQIYENDFINEYSAKIVIPNTEESYEKSSNVRKNANGVDNDVVSSVINLTNNHLFVNGESVRIISDNGHLPDGIKPNQIYYVITSNLNPNQIKLAQTLNNAILGDSLELNTKGGNLKVVSRVSDKNVGEPGHPIQWDSDTAVGNWYINVSSTDNTLYNKLTQSGVSVLGEATSRTYIKRKPDTRNLVDTLYRFRYVIPNDSPIESRPPLDGYIIQESSSSNSFDESDVQNYFSDFPVDLTISTELRNPRFIADAVWSSGSVTVKTELPHDLSVGTEVEISNILPSGYNGNYLVTEIINSRQFRYSLAINPGAFASDTISRTINLPILKKKTLPKTYQIYRTQEIQPYIPNKQDGVYHLIVTNCSNSPTVTPFRELQFNQPIQNLYPQTNRDNPVSDPNPTKSFALPEPIGQVVIDDPEHSITKETLEETFKDFNIGIGITSIVSNSTGTAHTIFTSIDHGFSGISSVSIISGGSNYINGTYYGVDVVGFAGSTVGQSASVKISVTGGSISSVEIMSGGSAYGIGNTLSVIPAAGIGTAPGFVPGVVSVTSINNNIEDALSISGVGGTYSGYNTLYRITSINNEKSIQVDSASVVNGYSQTAIGSTVTNNAFIIRTGKSLEISSFDYTANSGIATVTFTENHGLLVNNKIRLSGFDSDYFNKDVIVKRQNSLISVVVNVGKDGESLPTTGTRYAYRNGYASNAGSVSADNENIGGRLIAEYDGVTSIINNSLETTSTFPYQFNIENALELGLKVGDYLQINNEVFRIKTTVTGNIVTVFRSLFGTKRETHVTGSVVRRIKVLPIELRRNSIIRASGHTFEYVGFGPGNYSTALPERQDRVLAPQEELLAQATKENGGIVNFTAMNGDGDFFTGNKKINSATGQEEVFDTPIPTVTGEELSTGTLSSGFDILSPLEATITRSLRVEGGPENNLISEFDGPVVFNGKITSYSDQGIEASSLYLQGNEEVSRRISIISEKPDFAGNYGDIEFNSEPERFGFAGWIYTTENEWQPWGFVGGPGVGIATNNSYVGFSTLVNIQTSGINLSSQYDIQSGISTIRFDADPRVTVRTGVQNTLVGLITQFNFVGSAVTVTGSTASGIATVNISMPSLDGIGVPGGPLNSLQWNNGGNNFGGTQVASYDNVNNRVVFGDISLYNAGNILNSIIFDANGYVGFSSATPSSKIEIVADNERALYIKSTQGTEIVRVENTTNDSTPFIIDQNGSVGINTINAIAPLDVLGNSAVTGQLRIYRTGNRNNYVGLIAPSISSNFVYTFPNSYGTNGQVLVTNGSGGLSWQTFAGGNVVIAGAGITITYSGQNATLTNNGVRRVIAGAGISVSPASGTGDVTITHISREPQNIYPFTTRGFSMPI
jgi:hypothetical protein